MFSGYSGIGIDCLLKSEGIVETHIDNGSARGQYILYNGNGKLILEEDTEFQIFVWCVNRDKILYKGKIFFEESGM